MLISLTLSEGPRVHLSTAGILALEPSGHPNPGTLVLLSDGTRYHVSEPVDEVVRLVGFDLGEVV